MKVVRYKLVNESMVNYMIAMGWQPLGGVCFNGDNYVQAMVLPDMDEARENAEPYEHHIGPSENE